MLAGVGLQDDGGNAAAVAVALAAVGAAAAPGWTMSEVVLGIAVEVNTLPTLSVRERIGVGPEERGLAAETGLTLDGSDVNDAFVWMGLGCYTHPLVVPLIVEAGNRLGLFARGSNETVFEIWRPL